MSISLDAYEALSRDYIGVRNANNDTNRIANDRREQNRRFLLDQIMFNTKIGDKRRDRMQDQLDNGDGLIGIINKIRNKPTNRDLQVASDLSGGSQTAQEGSGATQSEPAYMEPTLKENIVREGSISPEMIQQARDIEKKRLMENAINSKNPTIRQLAVNATEEINPNLPREKFDIAQNNKIASIRAIESNADVINKDAIKGQNYSSYANDVKAQRKIDTYNAEAVKKARMEEAKALKARDMQRKSTKTDHYINVLNNKGISIPSHFTGNFAQQTGDALNIYGTLVDEAVSKGDWASARKFNREYQANMKNIYKSWDEDARGIQSLFDDSMIPKGTGRNNKLMTQDIASSVTGGQRKVTAPSWVFENLGTPEARKWLADHQAFNKEAVQGDLFVPAGQGSVDVAVEDKTGQDWGNALAILQKAEAESGGAIDYASPVNVKIGNQAVSVVKNEDGTITIGNTTYRMPNRQVSRALLDKKAKPEEE